MTIKSSKTLVEEAMRQIDTLNASEVFKISNEDKCTLIDIRDIRELWNEGGIENAIHIPRGMLEFWLDPESPYYKKEKYEDKSKKIILFCAGGMRSALATKTLKEMGYNNIAHVEGGFAAMRDSGFNLVDKKE